MLLAGLKDGRILHIVRNEDGLFFPEYDLKLLVPCLDRLMTASKMKIDVKTIKDQEHPNIFIDAIRYIRFFFIIDFG